MMAAYEYSDELILNARRNPEAREAQSHSSEVVQQELQQSIYDDAVTIFEVPVFFQNWKILQDRASIRMPSDFISRTEEEIASVYVLDTRPQSVYSNGYLNFMIALNWTNNLISNDNIHDFTQLASRAIERVGPSAES